MSDWAVGLSTGCFYRTSIFDCLDSIRNAGFGRIEVCSYPPHLDYHDQAGVREAAKRLDDLGLEAYSFHAPFAEGIDITSPNQQQRQVARDELMRASDAAAELDVRHFVIHPGPEKSGLPPSDRVERMYNAVGVLEEVSRNCRRQGMALVLENMLPHLFSGHVRELLWILGALEETNVGICLDTGHAHLSGDLRTVAHKLSGHLWMVHASDNRGKYDDHLPPGDGEIRWDALLRQLHSTGFSGTLILEIAGDGDAQHILEGARRARRFLRRIARGIGLEQAPGTLPGS
ncbi:sugar phosphate isomerase/epimerase family protein [Candidatus Laterigemmans baculatus]|uniref:sugar phosphate isomerase/epimerase family protein n=1 Tax=Candidatus Laterigemmans baculatus TaxID=2770505 RepID=UPI0013DC701B|nr:sugar phosphate isomerase/epimerase family protein [Candidatus Laterigemmans baculatus]